MILCNNKLNLTVYSVFANRYELVHKCRPNLFMFVLCFTVFVFMSDSIYIYLNLFLYVWSDNKWAACIFGLLLIDVSQ